MEKRVLLAVVLSFIVLYAFQAMYPQPRPPQQQPAGAAPNGAQPQLPVPVEGTSDQAPSAAAGQGAPGARALVADAAERDVVFENDAVRGVFSTRGAVLRSWKLKRYTGSDGQPLELIAGAAPQGSARPFRLTLDDPGMTQTLDAALFKPSADSVNASAAGAELSFEYRDASGLAARKVFRFSPERPYEIGFTADVTGPGGALNPAVTWGPALGRGEVSGGLIYSPAPQPLFKRAGEDEERIGFEDVPEYRQVEGTMVFAGVDDHYFLTAAVPLGQPLRVMYEPVPVAVPGAERGLQFVSWSVRYPSAPSDVRFFAGPKDFDVLHDVDPQLTYAIHFGFFRTLVVPLLRALKWVNGYIGNYGWSIIALTVIINLVMFPLRHKSVVSMRRMQELQPEVKAIQDRYSRLKMGDPARQKMNVELMNLYRERGVNPASGCVPMLLTLPVLFAFYSMLSVAIELRGAPFVGWIRDLSVYDPWFVTPVLMGVTQFVQTKMTPATGDPQQQRIMLFMPLIFMSMFIWAPSGLVLYWTVSNIWAIGQQVATNRLIGPPQPRTVRPPAERRVKAAGGGRTEAAKERK